MKLRLILLLFVLCVLIVKPVSAQGPTPPPPLIKVCVDEGWGECVSEALEIGGLILLIIVIIFLIGLALTRNYSQGFLDSLKKQGEKDGAYVIQRLEISDTTIQYLERVSKTYSRFKFRGLPRTVAKGIKPPELDQAYISVRILPDSSHSQGDAVKKNSNISQTVDIGSLYSLEPIELVDALNATRNRRLAVIGVAGSGKSTLLQWVGLTCARAILKQKLTDEQNKFIAILGDNPPLPLFISLRAFNEYCKEINVHRSVKSLLDFMVYFFSQNQSKDEFTLEFFRYHLQSACMLMFDGIDEVESEYRQQVRMAVEQLLSEYDHNKLFCLITSRPSAAYVSDAMNGFRRCEVQRLTPEQRNSLIRFWHKAVYVENLTEGNKKAEDLIARISIANQQVNDLATTPLMVTIFCMVSYSHELPRLRARLYEDAVEVLLTETIYKEGDEMRGLDEWGGIDAETRRDRLAFIAFILQERNIVSMLETDLVELIWSQFGENRDDAEKEAERFLQIVAEHGGLLEAMDDQYGFFTHATFQEYLAGRHLAEEYSPEEQEKFLEDHYLDDRWEESLRLAAGYLSINGQKKADRFVNLLLELGQTKEQLARAITLAGLALSDIRVDRRLPETVRNVSDSILSTFKMNPPVLKANIRYQLGLALGEIGDPRFIPSVIPFSMAGVESGVRENKIVYPNLVNIPSGTFRMGINDYDNNELMKQSITIPRQDERPSHMVFVSEYFIGLYPVTNTEFRLFWEQMGYSHSEYWSVDGWKWRHGKLDVELTKESENLELWKRYKDWLEGRPAEKRDRPFYWDDSQWNAPNLPVVGVSWFEAEAYINWLKIVTGESYCLPTEAEWEKAARSKDSFLWPWGNNWDENKCNNNETVSKTGYTTPVGMYPHGTWLGGPLDMAGNVMEWCADWYEENEYKSRENGIQNPSGPQNGIARVLRGGSFDKRRAGNRCTSRSYNFPVGFSRNTGFRVAMKGN